MPTNWVRFNLHVVDPFIGFEKSPFYFGFVSIEQPLCSSILATFADAIIKLVMSAFIADSLWPSLKARFISLEWDRPGHCERW